MNIKRIVTKLLQVFIVVVLVGCSAPGNTGDVKNIKDMNPAETENSIHEVTESGITDNDGESSEDNESESYTDWELVEMARAYYILKHGSEWVPPIIEVDSRDGDTVTIHLYEMVEFADGSGHTATSDWYYVNCHTGEGENLLGVRVDLKEALQNQ